ncbi:tetratricopeptide repeat protein [Luteibacter sp. dw_328]|uniref:tetratricopeptide repeat protein n=1 Tax=Luteibacter sp. dw_328 TaxID=2719796 RepID=UPI001BD5CEBE|nr:tetratricopeptide repeat protein [Luteibacter sp. dw_328]
MELDDSVHAKIEKLCKQGDDLAAAGSFDSARDTYKSALQLLPGDHRQWEAATWIYAAIGDVHFRTADYEKCFKCFFNAVQCVNGLGNPFIHLRLGQCSYEAGNLDKSADELTRAYMGAGLDIFMDDDSKYLEFLETRIDI